MIGHLLIVGTCCVVRTAHFVALACPTGPLFANLTGCPLHKLPELLAFRRIATWNYRHREYSL